MTMAAVLNERAATPKTVFTVPYSFTWAAARSAITMHIRPTN